MISPNGTTTEKLVRRYLESLLKYSIYSLSIPSKMNLMDYHDIPTSKALTLHEIEGT